MDFISANYIWIILGVLILLMAIVGYFAEKTDFGRKGLNEEKPKVNKNDKIQIIDLPSARFDASGRVVYDENSATESPAVEIESDAVQDINISDEVLNTPFGDPNSAEELDVVVKEDLDAPFGDASIEKENINVENSGEPAMEAMSVEPFANGVEDEELKEEELGKTELFSEDLSVPFGDLDVSGKATDNMVETEETQSNEVSNSDEDLWKF